MRGVLDTTLCDKVNFVSDLWQVGNFLRVLWFSPTKTDSRDTIELLLKVTLNTIDQTKPLHLFLFKIPQTSTFSWIAF